MPRRSWHPLAAGAALDRVVMAIVAAREAGGGPPLPSSFTQVETAAVRLLPPWVVRAALLKSRGAWWLWCEPRRGARAGGGQLAIALPAGRYLIDLLDVRSREWFARESAAGPLVIAGLPSRGGPVLARFRRVMVTAARPRE